MMPGAALRGDVRGWRQRIDHAGARGAGGGHDHDWHETIRPIRDDARGKLQRIHAPAAIRCHQAHGAAADAGLMRDLEPGEMRLPRYIKRGPAAKCAYPVLREI